MMRRYEPKPWDIRRCDMIHADEGEYVLYCDAQTEIERLTKERDEARAQVAYNPTQPSVSDAQSDLEAYGREKMREGMQRAAEVAADRCAACGVREIAGLVKAHILADMETLK